MLRRSSWARSRFWPAPIPWPLTLPFCQTPFDPRKIFSIIGSYGWGGKTVETLAGMIPNLKVEFLDPVLCKGLPSESDLKALDNLAETVAKKHENLGIKGAPVPGSS
jgi:hypothetical protein